MPKLKNKSGAKKRFRLSASGKVIMGHAGKRHGMRKRPQKMIRGARGHAIMSQPDAKIDSRHFLIYATYRKPAMASNKRGMHHQHRTTTGHGTQQRSELV